MLAEPDTLFAARLTARSSYAVFRLNALAVLTIVVIVMDLAMRGRFFRRVRMISSNLAHGDNPLSLRLFNDSKYTAIRCRYRFL